MRVKRYFRRKTMKTLATTLLLLAALPTIAQEPPTVSLDAICKAADAVGETATRTEYEADPLAYADDFCALARYGGGHRAARQLSKAITVVRRFNNPNRYYFDPRRGSESGLYIQLLRPWMIEENKRGTADWQVIQAHCCPINSTRTSSPSGADRPAGRSPCCRGGRREVGARTD